MPNLVDLDNLDAGTIERIEAALAAYREAARKARRREIILNASKIAGENRRARKLAGIKLVRKPPNMTKGEFQQRARKAAETTAKRYPRKPLPPCEVCGGESVARALCSRHWKAWRRSGVDREGFVAWYSAE